MARFTAIVMLLLAAALSACAPIVSENVRRQADSDLTFKEVLADPEKYKGRMVIFSGTILESVNTREGTVFKVLQSRADIWGRPYEYDTSEGRFMAKDPEFRDAAIYAPGRRVTVAGRVVGSETKPLGLTEYKYPLLEVVELHLWKEYPPVLLGIGFSIGTGHPQSVGLVSVCPEMRDFFQGRGGRKK